MLMERQELSVQLRSMIPWLLWAVWKARNCQVFANKPNDPHILVATALEEMNGWVQQQSNEVSQTVAGSGSRLHMGRLWS